MNTFIHSFVSAIVTQVAVFLVSIGVMPLPTPVATSTAPVATSMPIESRKSEVTYESVGVKVYAPVANGAQTTQADLAPVIEAVQEAVVPVVPTQPLLVPVIPVPAVVEAPTPTLAPTLAPTPVPPIIIFQVEASAPDPVATPNEPVAPSTVGEKGHKTHEIEETKSRFVKRMFELYGNGLYSLESLRQLLAKEGLRSRGGNLLSKSRTAEILGDPFYMGKVRWNGKVYPGKQKALVSNELFEAVQRILKGKTAPSKTKHFYLLAGFVRCEDCGGLVTWERQKRTVYGHCNTYRACAKRKWYKEADFETAIKQTLLSLQIKDKVLAERLSEALRASYKNTSEYRQKALQELNACVDRANQRLERLYDDKLDGKISTELYEKKQTQFATERDEALTGIQRQNESVDQYRELSLSVLELSQRAGELYEHATDEEKRKLIRLAFEKMAVKNGKLVLSFNEAFRVLYGLALEANGSKVSRIADFEENISEPSKKPVYKRQKSTFVPSRPSLLAWQSAFRTFNWREALGDPELVIRQVESLLSLV